MRTKKAKWMTAGALALALTVGAGAWLADGVANAATSKASTTAQATASDATKDTSNWKWSGDRGGRGGHGGFGIAIADESVATVLGLTADELKTELQAGKTLADIAKAQGVDAAKVTTAVQAVLKSKLDAALADGKLTQAQYDEQSAKLADAATSIVNGEKAAGLGFGFGGGGKGGHGGFGIAIADESVATALGLTADELKTELQAGKTLADIAKAQGVDAAKVTTAVQAVLKAKLDAALADGKLTQAQYDEQSAKLADAATSIVNGEKAAGMGFGGGRGGKGGPARGAASNSDSSASTSTSAT